MMSLISEEADTVVAIFVSEDVHVRSRQQTPGQSHRGIFAEQQRQPRASKCRAPERKRTGEKGGTEKLEILGLNRLGTVNNTTITTTTATTTTTTARIERRKSRFFTISSLRCEHECSSGPGAIVCKSRATHRALNTCNMSLNRIYCSFILLAEAINR